MIQKFRNIFGNSFLRNTATVATGAAAAQAITMAASPIIARLYGPDAFGLQGLFLSILNLLLPLSLLGYPAAIILPKKDDDALVLIKIIVFNAAIISLLIIFIILIAKDDLLDIFNAKKLGNLIYFIPPMLFVSATSITLNNWIIRKGEYGINSRYQVISSIMTNFTKSGLGAFNPSAGALIGSNILGGLIGLLLTLRGWMKSNYQKKIYKPIMNRKKIIAISWKYRDFPLYRTPQHFITTFSHNLPVFVLAASFGSKPVGHYTIAIAALALPASLIGDSVASVFYPHITSAIRAGENARKIILRATFWMATVGSVPSLLLIAIAPALFQFVFGSEWRESGQYAQWLAPWIFLQFVHKPAASAVSVLGLNKSLLAYEMISSAGKFLALFTGSIYFDSAISSIALFSAFGTISYIGLIYFIIKQSSCD